MGLVWTAGKDTGSRQPLFSGLEFKFDVFDKSELADGSQGPSAASYRI